MSFDSTVSPQAALITASETAKLLGIGVSTFWRTQSAGKIPEPVHLGGRTLWRIEEIKAWVNAGCPVKADWKRHELNRWSSTRIRTLTLLKKL